MKKTAWNHPASEPRFDGPIPGHLARAYVQHGYYVVIAAERAELSDEENTERTLALAARLNELSLSYVPTCGTWEGTREHGFLVLLNEDGPKWPRDGGKRLITDVEALVELAFMFEQDAILVAQDGGAHIIGSDGAHLDCFCSCEVGSRCAAPITALFPAVVNFRWENF